MASEPPVAVYDACVLYPFHLRNVLVQCAFDGLVEARWTDDIHAEWMRNLAGSSPGTPLERLERTRDLMKAVLPDALRPLDRARSAGCVGRNQADARPGLAMGILEFRDDGALLRLAKRSEKDFERLLRERLLAPLGMNLHCQAPGARSSR